MHFFGDRSEGITDRSIDKGSRLRVAVSLHAALDLRGQGGEMSISEDAAGNAYALKGAFHLLAFCNGQLL